MKKITGLLAVSLLSLTATAFGQNGQNEGTAVAQDVKTVSLQTKAGGAVTPNASFVFGLGFVTSTWVDLGPSLSQEYTLNITGLHLSTGRPSTVVCQPRQNWNFDFGFPDAFACQVITTAPDHIKVRVRRLDSNSGWGQDLRLDLLIFDWVNN